MKATLLFLSLLFVGCTVADNETPDSVAKSPQLSDDNVNPDSDTASTEFTPEDVNFEVSYKDDIENVIYPSFIISLSNALNN